jgi:Na+-translocating ferredoxin:NAD+ oxidoreductase RnfD subunit
VKVRRFFRTPKGLLIVVLGCLTLIAVRGEGLRLAAPGVIAAVITAMVIDGAILRVRKEHWVFPDGALLTGLIIAMVLSPHQPWRIAAITSALGVVSKYLVRVHTANVFNPAALALVVTFHALDTGQSWWGAMPELPPVALVALFAGGLFIAARVNKLPSVVAFLGVYYLLFTLTAFIGDPARVAELYRTPDVHAALYFAFFMVTDPPTSPPAARHQVVYGTIVAAVSFAAFETIGAADFLLIGLLVANCWEGVRRFREHAARVTQMSSRAKRGTSAG